MTQQTSPLHSLAACGTKIWLDSIDPDLVVENKALGITGATSNPIIVADLIKSGRFDDLLKQKLVQEGLSPEEAAWQLTDYLVKNAQDAFISVWEATNGNDGYVSFEIDPLLEDSKLGPEHQERIESYISLGKHWAKGHQNRMIKVPASPAGLGALEQLVAAGITVNVTLIFTMAQYKAARDAVWRGAQQRGNLDTFKSVYSIFVSRVDVYTAQHVPELSAAAQSQVALVNAKRIAAENQAFWKAHPTPLQQEIIFASTGVKNKEDSPTKYIGALAGSDIQTNPPATNAFIESSGLEFSKQIDQLPSEDILNEIDAKVDMQPLEETLMQEGIAKFADPHKALLTVLEQKRKVFLEE